MRSNPELFSNWEESLLFDIPLRKQYAISIEEKLGWPTHHFNDSIFELAQNNYRARMEPITDQSQDRLRRPIIEYYQVPISEIAEVIQTAITKPFKVDRELHRQNLEQNRAWLFEWWDQGWYKKWLGHMGDWSAPEAQQEIETIKLWTNRSFEAWKNDDLWGAIIAAEQSIENFSWPRTWASRYRDALFSYLAEIFAPKHYAWKALLVHETLDMSDSTQELDGSREYLYVTVAINTTPDQNVYALPDSLKQKPLITISLSYAPHVIIPCSPAQSMGFAEHFIENAIRTLELEGFADRSTNYVEDLRNVQAHYQEIWRHWLNAEFCSIEGEPTDHFRRSSVPLADRWSLLASELSPKTIILPDSPEWQNVRRSNQQELFIES